MEQDLARTALRVAGIDIGSASLERVTLGDGRSGSAVIAIAVGGRRFVLKTIHEDRGFRLLLRDLPGGEAALWESGLTRALPAPLAWPVLAAGRDENGDAWLLMRDVSEGILPRGEFDPGRLDALLGGMAHLHARYWDDEQALASLPLVPIDLVARLFGEPSACAARKTPPASPWVRWMLEDFVLGHMVPLFMDVLDPQDADFYAALVSEREPWLAALGRCEPTFLHGDLRRANIAYMSDGSVCLLDWERAMKGHAAIDLAWHWFLQFWAYPPAAPHDPDAHLRAYLAALEAALGRSVERARFDRAWGLAWLKIIAEIGYLIADPLAQPSPSAIDVERAKVTGRRAIALARRALDTVG